MNLLRLTLFLCILFTFHFFQASFMSSTPYGSTPTPADAIRIQIQRLDGTARDIYCRRPHFETNLLRQRESNAHLKLLTMLQHQGIMFLDAYKNEGARAEMDRFSKHIELQNVTTEAWSREEFIPSDDVCMPFVERIAQKMSEAPALVTASSPEGAVKRSCNNKRTEIDLQRSALVFYSLCQGDLSRKDAEKILDCIARQENK